MKLRINKLKHEPDVLLDVQESTKDMDYQPGSDIQRIISEQAEATLKLKGGKGYFEIPVCKADKRFFPFQFC